MSEIKVDWMRAPFGTDKLIQVGESAMWMDSHGRFFSGNEFREIDLEYTVIATRPQQKTVADAYEAFDEEWNIKEFNLCSYSNENEEFFTHSKDYQHKNDEYEVCNREQFEAYAKEQEAEQEGKRWTHTYGSDKCYIKEAEPDFQGYIIIYSNEDGYMLVEPSELKPIKPTLTKEQAWDKAVLAGNMSHITDNYDII